MRDKESLPLYIEKINMFYLFLIIIVQMFKNAWASVIGHQWVVPQWRPSVRLTAIFSRWGYVWQWPKWQVDSTADLKLLELTIFPHHFQLARRAENRKIKKH